MSWHKQGHRAAPAEVEAPRRLFRVLRVGNGVRCVVWIGTMAPRANVSCEWFAMMGFNATGVDFELEACLGGGRYGTVGERVVMTLVPGRFDLLCTTTAPS